MYAELKRKICPKCLENKELKDFGRDITASNGHSSSCRKCKKEWRANHRKSNPEKYRLQDFEYDLKKNYKMTVDQYNEMYDKQMGNCACCGRPSTDFKRGLHLDHDHKTGQVRALLCTKCNPGLGYFEDSIEKLEMAIAYLKKFKK